MEKSVDKPKKRMSVQDFKIIMRIILITQFLPILCSIFKGLSGYLWGLAITFGIILFFAFCLFVGWIFTDEKEEEKKKNSGESGKTYY
jgi:F0F1-type ATP synthase assembly protein I